MKSFIFRMPSLSLKSVIKQTTTKSWGGIFIENGKIKGCTNSCFVVLHDSIVLSRLRNALPN